MRQMGWRHCGAQTVERWLGRALPLQARPKPAWTAGRDKGVGSMSARSGTEVPPDGNAAAVAADAAAFGEFLRARRQRAGISLDQITSETKIPQRHFDALEHGSVRTWPRGMYTRAMLRAYAESVGLDREYVAAQFERVFEQNPPEAPPAPVAPPVEAAVIEPGPSGAVTVSRPSRRRVAPVRAAIGVAALGIIAVGAVFASREARVAATIPVQSATARPAAVQPQPAEPPRQPQTAAQVLPPRTEARSTPSPLARESTRPPIAPRPAAATEGELLITSDPPGARVMVNGVGWGSTPARLKYLPFGSKRIRLTKDGYVSAERSVSLAPDAASVKVQVKLAVRN